MRVPGGSVTSECSENERLSKAEGRAYKPERIRGAGMSAGRQLPGPLMKTVPPIHSLSHDVTLASLSLLLT